MKIKYIINFNQRTKLKKVKLLYNIELIFLNSIHKLKEVGSKWNIDIELISIEEPNWTKSKLIYQKSGP